MKASQVIEEIQKLISVHGDKDIVVNDTFGSYVDGQIIFYDRPKDKIVIEVINI